jgi:hypothetical protein
MLFVIKITLFYACLYKYSICMIFANPDRDSHEPSESSYALPSCAKIDLRSGSGRGARTSQNSGNSGRVQITSEAFWRTLPAAPEARALTVV